MIDPYVILAMPFNFSLSSNLSFVAYYRNDFIYVFHTMLHGMTYLNKIMLKSCQATTKEIRQLLRKSPVKSCELDFMPTYLLRKWWMS